MFSRKRKSTKDNDNIQPKKKRASRGTSQYAHWVFTGYWSNFLTWDPEVMRYMIYQWEVCPTTYNVHQQGYLELHNKITLSGLKKLLNNSTIQLQERRGTQDQAAAYTVKPMPKEIDLTKVQKNPAIKEELYVKYEFGQMKTQGQRTDIEDYIAAVKEGKTEKEIMTDMKTQNTWAKNERLYNRINRLQYRDKEKPAPMVWVLVGNAGSGKSLIASILAEYLGSTYTLTGNFKWWEDYENQDSLILEDYDGQLQVKDLLQLLDRYKCKREIKGSTVYVTSKYIFITCNDLKWIENMAVERRITVITNVFNYSILTTTRNRPIIIGEQ